MDSSSTMYSSSCCQFSLDEINIATNNFDKERILGQGGEATVYKAEVYLNNQNKKTRVAVKHLSKNSTEFDQEIQIVSKIQHPYVVALHGYCNESDEKILIFEYMKNGSLSDYVKQDSVCLTWTQRLNICLGAAYGLQHLHTETTEFSKGIIHRDVKPANILLDENWVAKVSDFGMFKLSKPAQIKSTKISSSGKGTPGYFAPEYYKSRHLTRKTDVYAFGVVLFEVLCRKKPWDRGDVSWFREEDEDLGDWARENVDIEIKRDITSNSLQAFTYILGKCLKENPKERPTMDGVVQSLELAIKCQELQNEDPITDLTPPRIEETLSDIETEEYMSQRALPEPAYEAGMSTAPPAIMSTEVIFSIKNGDLEELRALGSGTFGTVYHGKWRGSDVAIKRLKKSCFAGRLSEQERLTFWREADILSHLYHPNIVAFYGVVLDGPGGTLATVTEFMVDGSLRHGLLCKDRQLDHRKRLIIAMDAAFGMEYLHSKNIVHFDLKCENLLVNLRDPSRPICKVGDFGLSKIKRDTFVSAGVRGTLPWMAPELLSGGSTKVSEKVDVFSFGIVLWEILNMHYEAIIEGIVNNTLRPSIPRYCDNEWRELMEQCWAPNPAIRPSFTEITNRLRVMSTAVTRVEQLELDEIEFDLYELEFDLDELEFE